MHLVNTKPQTTSTKVKKKSHCAFPFRRCAGRWGPSAVDHVLSSRIGPPTSLWVTSKWPERASGSGFLPPAGCLAASFGCSGPHLLFACLAATLDRFDGLDPLGRGCLLVPAQGVLPEENTQLQEL